MIITRSQTTKSLIKEEKCDSNLLKRVSNTTRSRNKVTKRKTTKNNISLSPIREIKREEGTDNKCLLRASSNILTSFTTPLVSGEQIKQLIGYIVGQKMGVRKAASKVKMSHRSAQLYYSKYKEDPKRNIPLPENTPSLIHKVHTREQVETLIRCLVDEKMTMSAASRKANMSGTSARTYYGKYLSDPNRNIPKPYSPFHHSPTRFTQEQINALIGYIVNDKMTISAASMKATICETSGAKYYREYLNHPERKIPIVAKDRHSSKATVCTKDQIKKLIDNIANHNMTIKEASDKVNISKSSGLKYYQQYLKDPNHNIPIPPDSSSKYRPPYTHDQINKLISYIVDDKMSVADASAKVGMSRYTGSKYYTQYLDDPNRNMPSQLNKKSNTILPCSREQIKNLIDYIVNDKMSISAASLKVGMNKSTGSIFYRRYLNDPNHKIPVPREQYENGRHCSQEQIKNVIGYLVDDKMSLKDASRKANMSTVTAKKFYLMYMNDSKHAIPTPNNKVRSVYIYGQDKIDKMIDYIVKDKMHVKEASKKADINESSARRLYQRYLNDPSRAIPAPEETYKSRREAHVQKKIKEVGDYIAKDKMTITEASKKANVSNVTAKKYYQKYANQPNNGAPVTKAKIGRPLLCTPRQIKRLIGYIVDGNMSITKASEKVKISRRTGAKYYQLYLNDPKHAIPIPEAKVRSHTFYTREQLKILIGYIVDDKMSIKAASKKANMSYHTGIKYYHRYLEDSNHEIPVPKYESGYSITKRS